MLGFLFVLKESVLSINQATSCTSQFGKVIVTVLTYSALVHSTLKARFNLIF